MNKPVAVGIGIVIIAIAISLAVIGLENDTVGPDFEDIETENEVPQGNLIKLNLTESIGLGDFP
jgi:hypothetical protein